MPDTNKLILLAIIGKPHGLNGELRVKVFTDDPLALKEYRYLLNGNFQKFEIETMRLGKDAAFIKFKGLNSRSDAEAVAPAQTKLFIERQQLRNNNLEEDEFYQADLIGLRILDDEGKVIGSVSGVFNFGAGDLLEVKLLGKAASFIPFTKAAVPEINLKEGFIKVEPFAAGLIDGDDMAEQMQLEEIEKAKP